MSEHIEHGMKVVLDNGKTLKVPVGTDNRHNLKSIAGKLFHADCVNSVVVFNKQGKVAFYLRKIMDAITGKITYIREESEE